MTTFTIDPDNNITAHATDDEAAAVSGADRFATAAEFAALAATWPIDRLVEVWNSLPGVSPVERFKDAKTAAGRIWKRIQSLGQAAERPPKKGTAGAQRRHVRAPKAKPGQKATRTKKAAPGRQKVAATAREGSKKADIIALLQKPKGATLAELTKATGWQKHSVRGFLSGSLGRKMGLTVTSTKAEGGERRYSIKA